MHDKAKLICIINLKIYENADEKNDSQVISYNAIMALDRNKFYHVLNCSSLLALLLLPFILSLFPSVSEITHNINLPKKSDLDVSHKLLRNIMPG